MGLDHLTGLRGLGRVQGWGVQGFALQAAAKHGIDSTRLVVKEWPVRLSATGGGGGGGGGLVNLGLCRCCAFLAGGGFSIQGISLFDPWPSYEGFQHQRPNLES